MNQAEQGDAPRGDDESFPRLSLPYDEADSSDPERCPQADQEVRPGDRIAHFRLEQELGRGAMGIVHLAYDTRLDRHVAIKSLPRSVVDKPATSSLWEREARLLASVNHPNIASIYDRLEGAKGRGYLVLEYVPGQTLAERMAEEPLRLEEALTIALQISEAVAAAHEHGVIHRDLKPSNVKVTPEGRVKVLDFGIAKAVSAGPSGEQSIATQAGKIIGTPAYMSPEQARGKSVDARADVWSFGCIMFEMFSGRVPFAGDTVTDTLARVIEREPDWELLPRDIPRNMCVLVRRCLNKNPRRRLRDMGDAALEIGETLRLLAPPTPETEVASGSDVFISHVKEDADIARRIARGLKEAGYTTWHCEHDSVHGPPYEDQVAQAIEHATVVLLVISRRSLVSAQVTNEVLAAYESHKHFVPVLYGITRTDFQKRQPVWRQCLGKATFVSVPLQGVRPILPRIINGLASLGVQPSGSPRSVEQTRGAYKHKYLMLTKYKRRWLTVGLCLLAGLLVGVSWIVWFRSEPAGSPKPPATMRFQQTVMHLIGELRTCKAIDSGIVQV